LGPALEPGELRSVPRVAALERLLARASIENKEPLPYEAELCDLFGVKAAPGRDLPIAALTHLVDFDDGHEGVWMRADPVYLHPDLSKLLLLLDAEALRIERADAQSLLEELNAGLNEEDWRLIMGKDPARWYLHLKSLPEIRTCPPLAALGRPVDSYLPAGPESRRWQRLTNEAQMILHAAEINRTRQTRGDMPVNSLWFWGAGTLPYVPPGRWSWVFGDDLLVQALAKHCACPYGNTPITVLSLFAEQNIGSTPLVVISAGRRLRQAHDVAGWRDYLSNLEKNWFVPILALLRQGHLASVELLADACLWGLTRRTLWRFWKKTKPLGR